jgi:hypothetical protein
MAGFMSLKLNDAHSILYRPKLESQIASCVAFRLPGFYILVYEKACGVFIYEALSGNNTSNDWDDYFVQNKNAIKIGLINSGSRQDFLTNLSRALQLLKNGVNTNNYGWHCL